MSQPTPSEAPLPAGFTTRVALDAGADRADDLARALARLGFALRREAGRLVAESERVEAQDARRQLRALGFGDREYQVSLEHVLARGVR
ncbi:MAG TPA: hypothetical protein VFL83_06550 [Anaeromyxobacter sp.]|nr:hypothetical protein [Anaeromyxobacter sp.]